MSGVAQDIAGVHLPQARSCTGSINYYLHRYITIKVRENLHGIIFDDIRVDELRR